MIELTAAHMPQDGDPSVKAELNVLHEGKMTTAYYARSSSKYFKSVIVSTQRSLSVLIRTVTCCNNVKGKQYPAHPVVEDIIAATLSSRFRARLLWLI